MTTVVFYIFAAIMLFSAFKVITSSNPVHAALSLVLAFITAAGLWLLIEAEFLAISLVLVYVGAVMVLFLFVVMMLDVNFEALRRGFWAYLPVASFVGVIIAAEMVLVFVSKSTGLSGFTKVVELPHNVSNIEQLGLLIYTEYLLPFELAAVLLVVAIISAISLTLRRRKNTKYLDPSEQVSVKANDRVRIVKVAPIINDRASLE